MRDTLTTVGLLVAICWPIFAAAWADGMKAEQDEASLARRNSQRRMGR